MSLASGVARGLPGIPSGRGQFPRLQLRGSAGFAPASLSSPSGKDARSEGITKSKNGRMMNVMGRRGRSQMRGGQGDVTRLA